MQDAGGFFLVHCLDLGAYSKVMRLLAEARNIFTKPGIQSVRSETGYRHTAAAGEQVPLAELAVAMLAAEMALVKLAEHCKVDVSTPALSSCFREAVFHHLPEGQHVLFDGDMDILGADVCDLLGNTEPTLLPESGSPLPGWHDKRRSGMGAISGTDAADRSIAAASAASQSGHGTGQCIQSRPATVQLSKGVDRAAVIISGPGTSVPIRVGYCCR